MSLMALIALLLIAGVIMCLFDVDAGMKKLIYVVAAVIVIVVLLNFVGVNFGSFDRLGH